VRAPAGHKVHDLLSAVSGIEVEEGEPMLEFAFGSPEGTITFSADNPTGVKFPGFEEGDSGCGDGGDYKFPGMPKQLPTGGKARNEDDSDNGSEVSDADSDSDSDSD